MRKLLLLCFILSSLGFASAQENFSMKQGKVTKKNIKSTQEEDVYLLDSLYIYNSNYDALTDKSYFYYNEDNLEESELMISIDIWNGNIETLSYKDSSFYDSNNNLILLKVFEMDNGYWIPTAYTEFDVDENSRLNGYTKYIYEQDADRWTEIDREEYVFDEDGNMIEKKDYSSGNLRLKFEYSDFIAVNKPQQAEVYGVHAMTGDYQLTYKLIYEYDDNLNLILFIEQNVSDGEPRNTKKEEWEFNELNQPTEYIFYYVNQGETEFIPDVKIESFYDSNNNLEKELNSIYMNNAWKLSSEFVYFWSIPGEEPPVSIKPVEELADVYASYNAQSKQIIIRAEEELSDIQLYNISGSMVNSQVFSSDHNFEYSIPVNLQAGLYLIKINAERKSRTQKILVHE